MSHAADRKDTASGITPFYCNHLVRNVSGEDSMILAAKLLTLPGACTASFQTSRRLVFTPWCHPPRDLMHIIELWPFLIPATSPSHRILSEDSLRSRGCTKVRVHLLPRPVSEIFVVVSCGINSQYLRDVIEKQGI